MDIYTMLDYLKIMDAKKLLENLSDEEQKFIGDFMLEYQKRFDKIPIKDLGVLLITIGSSLMAAGAAISKGMKDSK